MHKFLSANPLAWQSEDIRADNARDYKKFYENAWTSATPAKNFSR